MTKTYKDTTGRELREIDGEWQMLKPGIGWVEFVGQTYIPELDLMITTNEPNKEVDQQVIDQKSIEDDLFRHYAGVALGNSSLTSNSEWVAKSCCEQAQAMIDELKRRGRL